MSTDLDEYVDMARRLIQGVTQLQDGSLVWKRDEDILFDDFFSAENDSEEEEIVETADGVRQSPSVLEPLVTRRRRRGRRNGRGRPDTRLSAAKVNNRIAQVRSSVPASVFKMSIPLFLTIRLVDHTG